MAQNASDSQKVDYLWKKIVYGAAKTDISGNIDATNEPVASPLLIRGDRILQQSDQIPGVIPGSNSSVVTVYPTTFPAECISTAGIPTPTLTWQTGRTFWVPPEFGSTYQIKVYIAPSGNAANVASKGTQVFATGSGSNDLWVFDYQSGILNFNSNNTPYAGGAPISFTGNSVYISGGVYSGAFGLPTSGGSVGNLTISNVTISANSSAVSSSANIIFSTSGTGAVQFTGNNAIGLPVGNIANRPTTVNAGYLRFNTEFETIEVWDGAEWVQTSGGVITSDVLIGDGATAQFALSANTTTTGVLVNINGTIQKPSTAYSVSNNLITFTETPTVGDVIEVRKLSGGTISVNYGNADVAAFLTTYPGLYSNVQATSLITTNGLTNYSNVNASALITTNGLTNYSNVNASALITTNGLTNYSNVNASAYLAGNITVGNIAGKTSGFTLGYLEMPQVASGNVTLALSDSGKHFYNTTASPQTITVPSFANVAFGNGTVISIANQSTSSISVALQSDVILYLAGNATSASRTITSYGVATLLKVNTNTWFINGSGVA